MHCPAVEESSTTSGEGAAWPLAARLALRLNASLSCTEVAQVWGEALQQVLGWQRLVLALSHAPSGRVRHVLVLPAAPGLRGETPGDPLAGFGGALSPQRIDLALPLTAGGVVVLLRLERDRPYGAGDRTLVEEVSALCSPAMGRADAHERLQEAYRRSTVFGRLAHRLGLLSTAREAGQLIADIAEELIGWDACFFDLYDSCAHEIREMINIDTVGGRKQSVRGKHTSGPPGRLEQRVLDEGAYLLEQDPKLPEDYGRFGDESRVSASMLFVPARHAKDTVAFFSIQSYSPKAYTRDDLELLQTLADHCAGALVRIRLEERVRESEQRHALAASGANDGLWDWDMARDSVFFSARCREILGLDERAGSREAWWARVAPEHRAAFDARVEDHAAGLSPYLWHEHRVQPAEGSERWVLVRGLAVRDAEGRPQRMAGSVTDITEAKRSEAAYARLAFRDPLTHLPNLSLFKDRLQVQLQRARRDKQHRFALALVDVDDLGALNQQFGQSAGDTLLRQMADRMQRLCRGVDSVARMAGDEFLLLLDGVADSKGAHRAARRLLDGLQDRYTLGEQAVEATVSIGIVLAADGPADAEQWIADATRALQRAKHGGKNRADVVG